ncbi:hypothetical protein Ait01nite_020390 [Actinoplanes italicus]|uniref:Uncharacterized protein DUF397 n=1 Tax=Actinoplanes italicus TaxID=113567 RepID=A0A2T0KP93_9ACTN|nr:DUF397 domain-containing protein [Actinoplanes italicus]PRX25562.1 uncharacterized protein DUF397 [Actinoplanes italicus]GIE28994.1 hypothetical protein Ait01nite_020390 [Actinoplanes italicus]
MIDPEALVENQVALAAAYGDVVGVKSSRSAGDSNCVEVGTAADGTRILTDSKLGTNSPRLAFTPSEWVAFREGVRNGEFD